MQTGEKTKPQSAIRVQADAILDPIDPRIYGQNIEHMGRQVLGGLVAEPGSTAPHDERGFRLDVLESIRDLRPALLNLPPRKAVPLLDISATRDDDRLTVFVINRDPREYQAAHIDVTGFQHSSRVRVHGIAADGYSAENTVNDPEAVAEHVREMEWRGFFRFPPCSVTAIAMES